ncbi:MAG: hypothetical protein AAF799_44625 [Myxococcota bacterium]
MRSFGYGLLLLTAGLLACTPKAGGTTVTPQPQPEPEPQPAVVEALGDEAFVQARGSGATEQEAYAAATASLAEALFGDARWATLVPLTVHGPDADLMHAGRTAEGFEAVVGLTRARAAGVLSAFEHGEVTFEGPAVWRDAVLAYRRAHVAAQACARRVELFESECSIETADADAAVARLGEGLVLVSAHDGGVPVTADGHLLRTPAVVAIWGGVPVADLPLVVTAPPELAWVQPQLKTDLAGGAVLGQPEPQPATWAPVTVRVDGQALLGPAGAEIFKTELALEPRSVGPRRWTLALDGGKTQGADEARSVIRNLMGEAGYGDPVSIGAGPASALTQAPATKREAEALALGDAMGGRLDVVLVLTYGTRFASRMGGSRVWYEAEGELDVRDVWTGKTLATAKRKIEADGVGEARADKAARRKLAKTLIEEVLGSLP